MSPTDEPFVSWVLLAGRIGLALVYLVSAIHKGIWYQKAIDEFRHYRIPQVSITLPLTILLQLIGSLCLIVGIYVLEFSVLLALFTLVATIKVHCFWRMSGQERLIISRVALGNLGLIGGLLILAVVGPGRIALG